MTVDQFRSGSQGAANAERPTTTLIERLTQGEPYAISFGGQGGAWLPTLTELQDIIEDPTTNGQYLVRTGQEAWGGATADTITGSAGRPSATERRPATESRTEPSSSSRFTNTAR